ncbi:MAG TPA: ParB/RepB/Spo0J family partition protein [Clostridia bacterium]|nr:ParB/RepB/Spo0J family partition protein [Clostridia bacterium]
MKNQNKYELGGQILLIPQEQIVPNPDQPRRRFDFDELEGLADSIRHNGIIQPINVRLRADKKYELIAGERRLRASRMVGLTRVPCILMEATDEKSAIYSLLENLQRQDLGFFEEADAIKQLLEKYQMTQEEVAKKLGKAQSTLSNKLRLLKLPAHIREIVAKNNLTERHARALLRLESEAHLSRALGIIVDRRLNVSETDRLINQMLNTRPVGRKPINRIFKDVRIFVNTLNHAVDTMRNAGIDADSAKSETEEYIEYIVRIPKRKEIIVKSRDNTA